MKISVEGPDLKEGIWRVVELPKHENVIGGKEYNFLRVNDLSKAMTLASFQPHQYEIAKRIHYYINDRVEEEEIAGVMIKDILNIIKEVITEEKL